MNTKIILKRTLKWTLYASYLAAAVLLLLEVAYRYQIVDFYRTELNTLNDADDLQNENVKPAILAFGDSFTVQHGSWLTQLREELPSFRVINSAITGTSVYEASCMAPGRIKTFKPKVLIYQLYVGNDLLGIRHSLNWKEWSILRNAFWFASDRLRFLSYFNYKLGQMNWSYVREGNTPPVSSDFAGPRFNAAHYRLREKIYAQGDPFLISNSTLLKDLRENDLADMSILLKDIIAELDVDCKIYLVVIPNKAQLNGSYMNEMKEIGFQFHESFEPGQENYPFIEALRQHFQSYENVEIINPLFVLKQHDTPAEKMYYLYDEHLTLAGQRVVKDLLLNKINSSSPLQKL